MGSEHSTTGGRANLLGTNNLNIHRFGQRARSARFPDFQVRLIIRPAQATKYFVGLHFFRTVYVYL